MTTDSFENQPPALAFPIHTQILIGLAIGAVPAMRLLRDPVGGAVRGGRQAATLGASQSRLQSALVVAQVSLAFALLAGAGLFVKSYRELAEERGRLEQARQDGREMARAVLQTRDALERLSERLRGLG